MNDQPQVDNQLGLVPPVEKVKSPFLPDSRLPGPDSGSTALNLKKIAEQQAAADDPLIKALMQSVQNEDSRLPHVDKRQPQIKIEPKPNKQPQGFLAPSVNGFNNFLEGIWSALKSLILMKPQTGTG